MEKRRQEIRDRMNKVMMDSPKTYVELAKDIGVSNVTLSAFMRGVAKTNLRALSSIEKYITKKESEKNVTL